MQRKLSLLTTVSLLANVVLIVLLVYFYTITSASKAAPTAPTAPTAPSTTTTQDLQQAVAHLNHTPYGTALLKWDPATKRVTVTLTLSGLVPKSKHANHIYEGGCASEGKVLQPLTELSADENGQATATTTLPDAFEKGLPTSGWAIRVHNGQMTQTGTTVKAEEALELSCGELPITATAEPSASILLGATTAASQSSFGEASLNIENGKMTVQLEVRGLEPGSQHAAHIHAGSCQKQVPGTAIYPISVLTADAHGNAISVTTLPDVKSIPEQGWYINVHRTVNHASPTDTDPIACGNVEAP